MPIFEYRCPECRHLYEALIRGRESAGCPQCGSNRAEKLFSAPAAHVKNGNSLPIASPCPPDDAPPCGTGCCRL